MEVWRQCAHWLVAARVLPAGHRASSPGGQVWDLAQALRDGVLLCHLLNALLPRAVPSRDICPRPQMSQFLCLRNIRTFLTACADKFGLPKHRLFGAFDLFDVQDFGKVIETLSTLSWTPIAQSKGFTPFPSEDSVGDDDVYSGLSDLIDDTAEEDDDLYDCVEAEGDDGDDIYEDLMRVERPPATKGGVDRRLCCLQELRQTEERYTETLESICQHFLRPLRHFLSPRDMESIFINVEELLELHRRFLGELRGALGGGGGGRALPPLFLQYKERFLLYGRYCSQVEAAARRLDQLSTCTDLRMKLQECSQRANNGRFSLRDLLMVPMQRVLKYHLLLQELVKLTPDAAERERLRGALDAMRDLAQCVNEVKRDNETLKQLTSIQLCLHNMPQSLAQFGRPKIDGELKVSSTERRSKVDRYGFLLDKALIICKRRGDSYETKDMVDLQSHQLRDGGLGPRDGKKWSHTFMLLDTAGLQDYELFFKTRELKKKWLEQFEMALSNIFPEHALADGHEFQMFSFEDTTSCRACQMLLRGTFYQGYRCSRCRAPAHKECLGRVGTCGKAGTEQIAAAGTRQETGGAGAPQNGEHPALQRGAPPAGGPGPPPAPQPRRRRRGHGGRGRGALVAGPERGQRGAGLVPQQRRQTLRARAAAGSVRVPLVRGCPGARGGRAGAVPPLGRRLPGAPAPQGPRRLRHQPQVPRRGEAHQGDGERGAL
ncbi:proto-oncogene vav isoform X2 [Corvus moneduloides]|uniref:proto-oncogene vav isoform X2 n=1 Tax=Corvus moneduloides TaxID=1196302 RepID=UPI0013638BB3|nr:proto-oncogene vav isoform X2 [Corvus moneduloides]